MRKFFLIIAASIGVSTVMVSCKNESKGSTEEHASEMATKDEKEEMEDEEHEKYDGPMERGQLEFEKTRDPALDSVPVARLWNAINYASQLKIQNANRLMTDNLIWTERGPIFDTIGPSNGNGRAGVNYTAGRTAAVLVDITDPSGNTVFCGGIAGGLWKCTNFLDVIPNWQNINDNFDNMAISSVCQDPSNPDIIYFSTGEATSNADAVFGRGVFKSTDHGLTFTNLPSTASFNRNFKISCDGEGNVYLATRAFGLRRSNNGGTTWTDITPTGLTALNASYCTDIEISSTGKLHASFGYTTLASGGATNYRYTNTPGTVTSGTWLSSSIRATTATTNRCELATLADTLYAVTTNGSNNIDSCYKSIDGGGTWTKQNTNLYATGLTNTQGWYNISLAINPNNSTEIIMGGLDAYRSLNSGANITRLTYWVGTAPYVHADHHWIGWANYEGETRILMGTDGGLFLSRDNGATFKDKNRNLAIKQFFAVAQHPDAGSPYLIAGAQDNGCHQLKYGGLGPSIEVTGGDGCFVHINQLNPLVQFGSYVYNQYRRSLNGGATWVGVNPSAGSGLFVNPFDNDDTKNRMYAGYGSNTILRWPNNNTATSTNTLNIAQFPRNGANGNTSAFKVSPYTADRVFIGGSQGKIIRLDNADTVTAAYTAANVTDLTSTSFPIGFVNCVNTGTDDNNLVATFTNYGVNNVWVSTNGGTSWTTIDGNLPDMPVRWAAFYPNDNTQMLIATEAGVWFTSLINGSATQWFPSAGFPTVRTDMIKIRKSDGTVAVATHGRGLWTAIFQSTVPLHNVGLQGSVLADGTANLQWTALGAGPMTRYHLQYSSNGTNYTEIADLGATVKTYKHQLVSPVGYYRIYATEPGSPSIYSNTALLRLGVKGLAVKLYPNPVVSSANFILSSPVTSDFTWQVFDMQGRMLQSGKGNVAAGGSANQTLPTQTLPPGTYQLRVMVGNEKLVNSFIKK